MLEMLLGFNRAIPPGVIPLNTFTTVSFRIGKPKIMMRSEIYQAIKNEGTIIKLNQSVKDLAVDIVVGERKIAEGKIVRISGVDTKGARYGVQIVKMLGR
ncbi:MAG: FliM/FliN family flagellar motor switch protein [Patescibacteria group bacterium]